MKENIVKTIQWIEDSKGKDDTTEADPDDVDLDPKLHEGFNPAAEVAATKHAAEQTSGGSARTKAVAGFRQQANRCQTTQRNAAQSVWIREGEEAPTGFITQTAANGMQYAYSANGLRIRSSAAAQAATTAALAAEISSL